MSYNTIKLTFKNTLLVSISLFNERIYARNVNARHLVIFVMSDNKTNETKYIITVIAKKVG